MEAIRGSELRTDEQGSRLDHSHCNPFVAVDMTVAVREHFVCIIDVKLSQILGLLVGGPCLAVLGLIRSSGEVAPLLAAKIRLYLVTQPTSIMLQCDCIASLRSQDLWQLGC